MLQVKYNVRKRYTPEIKAGLKKSLLNKNNSPLSSQLKENFQRV